MKKRVVSRWKASAVHLGLSMLIAVLVLAVIRLVWYPGALFAGAGGLKLFFLIAGVDVVIGPVLTLIVFVPGKKGLKFDLVVIALAQVIALSYGTSVLFESRPVWIVFVKDRFELVRANEVMAQDFPKAKPPFDHLPLGGPRVVGARLPKDPGEQFQLAMSAAAGRDVQTYPQYLVPYRDVQKDAAARAKPLPELRALNPGEERRIDALPGRLGLPESRLGFLPMRAGKSDLTVLVDRNDGDFLGELDLKPWKY
jgi:hypothetical protein